MTYIQRMRRAAISGLRSGRAFLVAELLLSFGFSRPASAQVDEAQRCETGQIVKNIRNFDYCQAFKYSARPAEEAIDRKLELILRNDGSLQNKLRSYAFLVSISEYRMMTNPDDKELKGVANERGPLIDFLKAQGFDEIISLNEGEATIENINYFLTEYLFNEFKSRKDANLKTRFVFVYDRHGMPGIDANTHGALALSDAAGEDDSDPHHKYLLDDLNTRLKNLAALSYQTLALVGSCFSGGLFQPSTQPGFDFSYPPGPGAHAITAAKDNQLAWTTPGGKGTIFFSLLTQEVSKKHVDNNMPVQEGVVISGEDGESTSISDGVVTLDTIIYFSNHQLSAMRNPKSADKKYPHMVIGELLPADQARNGAFFFLEPTAVKPPAAPNKPPGRAASVTADAAAQASAGTAFSPGADSSVASAQTPGNSLRVPAPPALPATVGEALQTGGAQIALPPAVAEAEAARPITRRDIQLAARRVRRPADASQRSERTAFPATFDDLTARPPLKKHARAKRAARRSSEPRSDAIKSVTVAEQLDSPPSPPPRSASLPLETTGSAVAFHPELKVFKRPESYSIRGVDLSHWNGAVPFEKLAGAQEIRFAYLKATEGAERRDPAFSELLAGARAAKILTGAYHFWNFCDSPDDQVKNITSADVDKLDLPLALAIEWRDGPIDPKQRDCARDQEVVKLKLHKFLHSISEKFGKTPIIYAPSPAVGTLIESSFNIYPIWLADYHKTEGADKPTMRGNNPWTIWQFTDHAVLPGMTGPVDLNVFFGNDEQFARFLKGKGNVGLLAAKQYQ